MSNYNTNTYEIKREIQNFSKKLTDGLSKPATKFVCDFMYGLNVSKSTLISNIARELKEDIKLQNTIERLCDNINSFSEENSKILFKNYYNEIQSVLDDEVILYIDDTDITKPYGKKFEDLDYVVDGSAKSTSGKPKTELGYYVASSVVLSKNTKQPIPLYNKIYSLRTKDIKSKGDETFKSIDSSIEALKGKKILLVGYRGYDDRKIFEKCIKEQIDFNIRLKTNRKLWFKNKRLNALDIAKSRKGKVRMKLFFQEEHKDVYISYTRVGLEKDSKDYTFVSVYGLSEREPLILLTTKKVNGKSDLIKLVRSYFSRWRIEEYFKFIKSEGYENIRIRSLRGMNVVSDFVLIRTGHLAILADAIDKKLLVTKIIIEAKALRDKVLFLFSQVSNGIGNILRYARKGIKHFENIESREKCRQLSFKF